MQNLTQHIYTYLDANTLSAVERPPNKQEDLGITTKNNLVSFKSNYQP